MGTVLLSVILPVYNAQDYLERLLLDIQRQTITDFEVIIIDDGSSDNSQMICKNFASQDKRFHYSYQQNKGVSSARNRGIKKAKGNYITFLDADDRIPENRFEKLLEPLQSHKEIDIVIGQYQTVGRFKNDAELFWQSDLSGKKEYETVVFDCVSAVISFYYGVVWNKLYRKDIINDNQIRFDESLKWCEDFIFNLEYFRYIKYCYYLADVVYFYCYHKNSSMSNKEIFDDQLDFLRYQFLSRLSDGISNVGRKELYKKKVNSFLINRIHAVLSTKAKNWSIINRKGYEELKEYLLTPDSVLLWKQKNIFSNLTIVERIVWILMKIKFYYPIYVFYIMKNRIKVFMNRKQ